MYMYSIRANLTPVDLISSQCWLDSYQAKRGSLFRYSPQSTNALTAARHMEAPEDSCTAAESLHPIESSHDASAPKPQNCAHHDDAILLNDMSGMSLAVVETKQLTWHPSLTILTTLTEAAARSHLCLAECTKIYRLCSSQGCLQDKSPFFGEFAEAEVPPSTRDLVNVWLASLALLGQQANSGHSGQF